MDPVVGEPVRQDMNIEYWNVLSPLSVYFNKEIPYTGCCPKNRPRVFIKNSDVALK